MKKNVFFAVALIALMTGVLSAQTYDSESDFQVKKNGNAITITKYVGKNTAVNIPPTIQNTPVTAIGDEAFKNNSGIRSVTIPSSVTSIGRSAFAYCIGLTSVTFQGTITSFGSPTPFFGDLCDKYRAGGIGTYTTTDRPNDSATWTKQPAAQPTATPAQYNSEKDFQVKKAGNAVTITKYVGRETTVNIPPTIQNSPVTEIGAAFENNKGITSVTIPDSVTSIGNNAFANCAKLTSVTIGNGVTTIGNGAFAKCANLESVIIGTRVTTIGEGAFADCAKLAGVTIPSSVTSIGLAAFTRTGLTNAAIPNSVTAIADGLFSGCAKLTTVTIGKGVASIGQQAFDRCTSLISVTFEGTIPSSGFVNRIDNYAAFPGDLRFKFYATDANNGTAGTYTRPAGGIAWTKK